MVLIELTNNGQAHQVPKNDHPPSSAKLDLNNAVGKQLNQSKNHRLEKERSRYVETETLNLGFGDLGLGI
jgi:hypothetical protein